MEAFPVPGRSFKIILAGALVSILFLFAHAQDPGSIKQDGASPEEISRAFKKAMQEVYAEQEAKQKQDHFQRDAQLESAINEWIASAGRKKQQEINQLVSQEWEKAFRFGPRVHYDYYLRGYDYLLRGREVSRQESLQAPYTAKVIFLERLYVQRKHPASASNVRVFFYTVETPITVQFDYRGGNFFLAAETRGDSTIEKDWTEEAIGRIKKENFQF